MNNPGDSVRIVLFDTVQPDHFVIGSEADDPDNLKLPGGRFASPEEPAEEAAYRENGEELDLTREDVELTYVGELVNDDGVSRRHIFFGRTAFAELRPTGEMHRIVLVDVDSIPSGKNYEHMRSAAQFVLANLAESE